MDYGFDRVTDRRGTGSLKWDVKENELPMWVADMDFPTAPCIRRAIEKRAAHGIFGYSVIPDAWYDAYRTWWGKHHGLEIGREELIFTTGVIPALSTAVRKFTTPAEKIVIQTPVYNIFFNSIVNNGRRVMENPLVYRDGIYEMDFADLEEKLSDPLTTMMILCNPQNPAAGPRGGIVQKTPCAGVFRRDSLRPDHAGSILCTVCLRQRNLPDEQHYRGGADQGLQHCRNPIRGGDRAGGGTAAADGPGIEYGRGGGAQRLCHGRDGGGFLG